MIIFCLPDVNITISSIESDTARQPGRHCTADNEILDKPCSFDRPVYILAVVVDKNHIDFVLSGLLWHCKEDRHGLAVILARIRNMTIFR